MTRRFKGGPASIAGPLLVWALALLGLVGGALAPAPARAVDWIPPSRMTALFPSATIAPATTRALTLTVRANGAGASIAWSATSGGTFVLGMSPASGAVSLASNGIASIPIDVTVPALGVGSASISIEIQDELSGVRYAKVGATIQAATDGRPEVWPVPSTFAATSGTSGSASFQVHSLTGVGETMQVVTGRFNPDTNNSGGLFTGAPAPTSVFVPGGGTVTVNVPTVIAARAVAGNANAVQLSVSNTGGISNAVGYALSNASLPDSLPTALVPRGVVPFVAQAAGRDGPALLASRGYWLVPCGEEGVRVIRQTATDSIGIIDVDGDGDDDRIVGTIRIPSYAAALSVLPGFVAPSGDTLDLGLLAAGRGGLMLLDLRVVEDPIFGTWEDFFDSDANGIDDRILRVIPTPGFATDAAWVTTPTGRHVGFVADADTGSVPVAASYNPALTIAGTGAGIVAVDLEAAIDSLGGIPPAAGTLPTQGSALDLEVRHGGSSAELALADGSGAVSFFGLSFAAGVPATVTFTPRGDVPLSGMWGAAYARDLEWIPNSGDSAYVALASGAAGVQIIRAPRGGQPPALVLAQQTAGPASGIGGAWTGTLGVAMGSAGIALMTSPGAGELDKIQPGAPAPYTQPVNVARFQSWAASGALERALHSSWATSATALRFREGQGAIPDLVASDGSRLFVLRPGTATITGVGVAGAPAPRVSRLRIAPNPSAGLVWIEAPGGGFRLEGARPGAELRVVVTDVRGRLVRALHIPADGSVRRVRWDGRDERGRLAASGRYWARMMNGRDVLGAAASFTLLR